MNRDDCRNELVQLARRTRLSSNEQLALDAHVRACESCRLTQLFGHDFDAGITIDSADGQQLERMMLVSQHWVDKPRRLVKPSGSRWLLAATATTMAAAATTIAVSGLHQNRPPPADGALASAEVVAQRVQRTQPALVAETPKPTATSLTHATTPEPTATSLTQASAAESTSPAAPMTAASLTRVASWTTVAPLSAEQLLQKANLARRNGDTKEAIRLFRRLQREYSGSREAGLSLVALGTLLLEQGQTTLALEQFNRYLAAGAGAALTAEALYGKGRTLAQLGLADQERGTWHRLLAEYPKSPYVTHANRRLAVAK